MKGKYVARNNFVVILLIIMINVSSGFNNKENKTDYNLHEIEEIKAMNVVHHSTKNKSKTEYYLKELNKKEEIRKAEEERQRQLIYKRQAVVVTEEQAKDYISFKESTHNYNARNGKYYGRWQLDESYLNGDLSPENQDATVERYVNERYGSWQNAYNFWINNGWY